MDSFADAVRAALTAELRHRPRWDEPPALLMLYHRDGEVTVGRTSIVPQLWCLAPAAAVLNQLAWSLEQATAREIAGIFGLAHQAGLCGIAFRHEAWMASLHKDAPPALRKQFDEDGREHRIHTRPDRVEIRIMVASTTGGQFMVTQTRNGEPEVPAESIFTGAIPEALLSVWRPVERAMRKLGR